jgi:hypothetical protein
MKWMPGTGHPGLVWPDEAELPDRVGQDAALSAQQQQFQPAAHKRGVTGSNPVAPTLFESVSDQVRGSLVNLCLR